MTVSYRRWFLLAVIAALPIGAFFVSGRYILKRFRAADPPAHLVVDLSERELRIVEDGSVTRTYGVAIGTRKHPTPTGSFRTGRIDWNPRWVPPPSEWARRLRPREPGDPRNPMQGVKIYFREPWYFIHGTNDPESIGTAASHGCLRMQVSDAKSLARFISDRGSMLLVIQD
jgi:lipoprotein-anchoring transpeptidase ErfK/SrfK